MQTRPRLALFRKAMRRPAVIVGLPPNPPKKMWQWKRAKDEGKTKGTHILTYPGLLRADLPVVEYSTLSPTDLSSNLRGTLSCRDCSQTLVPISVLPESASAAWSGFSLGLHSINVLHHAC